MPVPGTIMHRRARRTAGVQGAGDVGHAVPGEPAGEDPSHVPCRHRIWREAGQFLAQRACAGFGCGPISTSWYPYGGRPPRQRPWSQVWTCIASRTRCRDRCTSRNDRAPSSISTARCTGSSPSPGPRSSGRHDTTPARLSAGSRSKTCRPQNARSYSPATTASASHFPAVSVAGSAAALRPALHDGRSAAPDVEILSHDRPGPDDEVAGTFRLPPPGGVGVLVFLGRQPPVEHEPHRGLGGRTLPARPTGHGLGVSPCIERPCGRYRFRRHVGSPRRVEGFDLRPKRGVMQRGQALAAMSVRFAGRLSLGSAIPDAVSEAWQSCRRSVRDRVDGRGAPGEVVCIGLTCR